MNLFVSIQDITHVPSLINVTLPVVSFASTSPMVPPCSPRGERAGLFSYVALCIREPKMRYFTCHLFDTYEEANAMFFQKYMLPKRSSTAIPPQYVVVPLSKFWPRFLQPTILKYKTANVFNRVFIEPNPYSTSS